MLLNKLKYRSGLGGMMFVLVAGAMLSLPRVAWGSDLLVDPPADEKFVPMGGSNGVAGTLEVRVEVRVDSAEVRLRDVCRWSQRDDQAMAPVADLVITRLGSRTPYQAIGVEEIKSALREAGINLGLIRFSGSQVCTVGRSDPAADPINTARQWGDVQSQASQSEANPTNPSQANPSGLAPAQVGPSQQDPSIGSAMNAMAVQDASPEMPVPATGAMAYANSQDSVIPPAAGVQDASQGRYDPVTAALHREVDDGFAQPAAAVVRPVQASNGSTIAGQVPQASRTLKQALLADLAQRLNAPSESLLVEFRPEDEARLALSEPAVRFDITSRRVATLGKVNWEVVVSSAGGVRSQPMTMTAYARQWQEQVVAARPISYKQLLRAEDLATRRVLVDQLNDSVLLTADQVVGQMASVQIKPGAVFTARMVDPVPLVSSGQLVTISLKKGSFEIKTVARALEGGTYGQSIRVRNEVTRDVFQVVVTGAQTGSMSQPDSTGPQDVASASGL